MFNYGSLIHQLVHALGNGTGRHHAGDVAGEFAVFEEIDGRQTADAHLVRDIFGNFDIYPVAAYGISVVFGKPFDDGIHDSALAQPLGSEDDQKRFSIPVPQQIVEFLFAYCRVCI